jgi:8-oxo-dGTP diphosphatase
MNDFDASNRALPGAPAKRHYRVAAGILRNASGDVLLAQRPDRGELANLWEFPGGKLEPGESVEQALARELHEELGITVRAARPFRTVHWVYREHHIELITLEVDAYAGEPHGREGQALRWLAPRALLEAAMPPADRPLAVALNLPRVGLVTPEPGADHDAFVAKLERALANGVRLVQLRAKTLEPDALRSLAVRVRAACTSHGALALLNGEPALALELGFDGVHLPAAQVARFTARPAPARLLLGASCHDASECERARAIGADYLVVAPIRATASKPGAVPIGWERFAALAAETPLPCLALGGVGPGDLETARAHGAHGIAAISALWA